MSDFPSQRMREVGDFLKSQSYALLASPKHKKYYLLELKTEKEIEEFAQNLKEKQND